MITAHYQTPDGAWHEFEQPPAFLHQSTGNVVAMMEGNKLPVVVNIDGGYICTSGVMAEVRRNQPPGTRVIAFRQIRAEDRPFYKTLGIRL